jgi:hypothetical protein
MIFCYIMYIINIVVDRFDNICGMKPRMIGSGLSYEFRVIRSVNRLHVDNLGPSGIGWTLSKFW